MLPVTAPQLRRAGEVRSCPHAEQGPVVRHCGELGPQRFQRVGGSIRGRPSLPAGVVPVGVLLLTPTT